MTTRQYIGARYIPVFADPVEWTDERTYEPLTMVQHLGETYMTKQAVPLGVQLPDTSQGEESNDYWVHMSNWNAQVETYRQEVLQYNGRISTLENDLPIADFDSTNTVKKAIDDAVALLPGTSFDSTNTVKKAIDDAVALLPGTAFDSTNTVDAAMQELQRQDSMRTIVFETVSDMKLSEDIENGMYVRTLGFNSVGDGGAALYEISDTGTANEMDVIACGDLYANLVIEKDYITPEMFGAIGDGTTDDHDVFDYIIGIANDKYEIHLNSKVYYLASPIVIPASTNKRIELFGTGQNQSNLTGATATKHIKYSMIKVATSFIQGANRSTSEISGIICGVGFLPASGTTTNASAYVFDTITINAMMFEKNYGRWIGTCFNNVYIRYVSRIQNNVFYNLKKFIYGYLVDSYVQNNYISGDASSDTICFDFSDCSDSGITNNFFDFFKYMYSGDWHAFISSGNVYEIFGNMVKNTYAAKNYKFDSIGDIFTGYDATYLTENYPNLVASEEGAFIVGGATELTLTTPSVRTANTTAYLVNRTTEEAFYPSFNYSRILISNVHDTSPRNNKYNVLNFVNFPNSYQVTDTSQRWWINIECTIPTVSALPSSTDTVWKGMKVFYNNDLYIFTGSWKNITS